MTGDDLPTREERIGKAVRRLKRALVLMRDAQSEFTLAIVGTTGLTLSQLEAAESLCRTARACIWDAIGTAIPHTKPQR